MISKTNTVKCVAFWWPDNIMAPNGKWFSLPTSYLLSHAQIINRVVQQIFLPVHNACLIDQSWMAFNFSFLNSFHPWIVSAPYWGNYSSFHYIRENVMRKLYEFFKVLPFQKKIVVAATIWGNTVYTTLWEKTYQKH